MAGDPLRDAFREQLKAIRIDLGISWPVRDTLNTADNPDAVLGYLELEFPGGFEDQFTFGAPGSNLFNERGQVTLRVVAPMDGSSRDTAEIYADQLRTAFRARRFPVGDRSIRIYAAQPFGGGHTEAGVWAESIGLDYQVFNVG